MQQKILLYQPNKILVIRRDNIGDLVCTTPAFAALRKHYPKAKIGSLVNSYNAEVLRGNPNVDQVFVYQKLKHVRGLANSLNALMQRLRLIVELRSWKPDVTILAKSSYDRHGLNFARQIGAKNIIGFVPDDLGQVKGLPDIQLRSPEFAAVHEVEALNQLLAPLGINDAVGALQVFADAHTTAKIKRELPDTELRIALHISAREAERQWGTDNFVTLTQYILQTQPHSQILLLWSPGAADDPRHPGDDDAAARLIETVQSDRLLPMPTQNLSELIAVLSLCDLFVGTDGGAMHLAVALKKRVLALFENLPGKLGHWYPWQTDYRIVHSRDIDIPDIRQIDQEQLQKALNQLFSIMLEANLSSKKV